jgi:hypothetical protein
MNIGRTVLSALLVAASLPAAAQTVNFSPFAFTATVSTSGVYGGVNGIYGNGDVRLDGVGVGGSNYAQSAIQTVANTQIVLDDGLDAVNGGGNLAAGRGINSVADTWAGEGPATVTPTSADLQAALANYNLTSIVVTRENPGTAIVDVSFAAPTQDFLFFERGFNSDLQVQALNASGQVIGTYTLLRANYTNTGITVSTDNGAFTLAGQALGSIGLHADEAVDRLRLSSYQSDVIQFNGPDYKLFALAPVPEPSTWLTLAAGLGVVGLRAARRQPPARA